VVAATAAALQLHHLVSSHAAQQTQCWLLRVLESTDVADAALQQVDVKHGVVGVQARVFRLHSDVHNTPKSMLVEPACTLA
jgi:hypothetical protein